MTDWGDVAIVGIGATEFSKNSRRSEFRLAIEAITAAVHDAGIAFEDIDGFTTFTYEGTPETALVRSLGLPRLKFFSRIAFGGGCACATLMQAALAVKSGAASTVVCYRAFNERSGLRFGQDQGRPPVDGTEQWLQGWYRPFGLTTAAGKLGLIARRYMHETGTTSEDLGRVSVSARKHAATNPNAWFYNRPITLEDHQNSRFIAEPLHLLDCCQESDGGIAIVVTSLERARDLPAKPVLISAAAQGLGRGTELATGFYEDLGHLPESEVAAESLWKQSGLGPADMDIAMLYDHFTPYVLMQLEGYGFCNRGEARQLVADGDIDIGGRLPVNPHGGLLGEAYIHGMNGITEAVRQIRGTAVNQISNAEHVLVTGGPGTPTSAVVLSAP
jgi:acetyl-CoA acetyltransferase